MGPPKGFQSLMDMHPGLKKPQTVINKASSDRLSKPKEGVKPVKKNKNPLDRSISRHIFTNFPNTNLRIFCFDFLKCSKLRMKCLM